MCAILFVHENMYAVYTQATLTWTTTLNALQGNAHACLKR
jgi:hypothetical protein